MSETPDKPAPEPEAFHDPYKDSNPLVTLVSFHDPFKADMARNRLIAAGIDAVVNGETGGAIFGGIASGFDAVQVQVRTSDVERGRRVLEEPVEEMPGAEPIDDRIDPTDPEYLAERAWRAAIFCLVFFPLFFVPYLTGLELIFYAILNAFPIFLALLSLLFIVRIAPRSDQLSTATTWKYYGALVIDGGALVLIAMIVRATYFASP